jgi:hypothetical protein
VVLWVGCFIFFLFVNRFPNAILTFFRRENNKQTVNKTFFFFKIFLSLAVIWNSFQKKGKPPVGGGGRWIVKVRLFGFFPKGDGTKRRKMQGVPCVHRVFLALRAFLLGGKGGAGAFRGCFRVLSG